MPDYQNSRFKKPFNKGGSRPYSDAPQQLYTAECSNCHASCEVPFRPNGKKPVFCRNCFNRDRSQDDHQGRPTGPKRDFSPRPSFRDQTSRHSASAAPAPKQDNARIEALARQITNLEGKIDRLFTLMDSATEAEPVAVKKAVTKKKKVSKK